MPHTGASPRRLSVFTNAPPPFFSSTGTNARVTQSMPITLVSKSRMNISRSAASGIENEWAPALLNTRFASEAVLAAALAWASFVTSSTMGCTRSGSISTAARTSSAVRPPAYTRAAPRERSSLTRQLPRPPPAPVTTALAPMISLLRCPFATSLGLGSVYRARDMEDRRLLGPRPSNSVWLRATAKRTYACCRASMDSRLAAPRPRCRVADRHPRVGEEVEGRADHLRDPFDPRQGDLQGGPANLVANGDRVGRRLSERTLARASRATERGRWAGASGPGLTTAVR